MEQFLLQFVNTFRSIHYTYYGVYMQCTEVKCGIFQFDNFRPLPSNVIDMLGLFETVDYDNEKEEWLYAYTPQFN